GYVQLAHLEAIPSDQDVAGERVVHASPEPPRLDPSLDLDLTTQRRIVEFEERLGGPDHILLGVAENADEKKVKRAYFKLSREFHPDRYFRRDLGPYRARLERLFKEIQRAYESHLQRSLAGFVHSAGTASPARSSQSVGSGTSSRPSPPAATRLERLSQRLAAPLPDHVVHERQQKARELLAGAEQAASEGHLQEALTCLEIVTRFDPGNRSAQRALKDLRMKLDESAEERLVTSKKTERTRAHGVSGVEGVPDEQDSNRGHEAR
ncbi:MAG: J domain-containing protein, partial [Myxococcota bacterium]